jgi:hypothetical protein
MREINILNKKVKGYEVLKIFKFNFHIENKNPHLIKINHRVTTHFITRGPGATSLT